MRLLLFVCVLAAAACGPQPPVRGIYQLTVSSTQDTCSPPRAQGDEGDVALDASGGAVSPGFLDGADGAPSGWVFIDVAPNGLSRTVVLPGCSNATLTLEAHIVRPSGPLEVELTRTYADVEGCSPGPAPPSSCRADQRLTYTLRQQCDAPCAAATDAPTDGLQRLHCQCP